MISYLTIALCSDGWLCQGFQIDDAKVQYFGDELAQSVPSQILRSKCVLSNLFSKLQKVGTHFLMHKVTLTAAQRQPLSFAFCNKTWSLAMALEVKQ